MSAQMQREDGAKTRPVERVVRRWDYCPTCGRELDTGWECNGCGLDWQAWACPSWWQKFRAIHWGGWHGWKRGSLWYGNRCLMMW